MELPASGFLLYRRFVFCSNFRGLLDRVSGVLFDVSEHSMLDRLTSSEALLTSVMLLAAAMLQNSNARWVACQCQEINLET